MKKLKIILQSNYLFYLLLIISIIYACLYIKFNKYELIDANTFYGYITDYNIDGDKLSLVIKSKEKLVVNYYFKSEKDKNDYNLSYGDYVLIKGTVSLPNENTTKGLFNYKKYLLSKKIKYVVNADDITLKRKNKNILYKLKKSIINRIDRCTNTSNYIKAFIMGDKKEIDSDFILSYQFLGVSHLLAISGMHVSLVSMLILKILNKIGNKKYIFVSTILLFYLFLTNYTISMLRASLSFILFSINKVFKLNIKNTNIIYFLVSILLLYNPYYIYDVSFKFSFTISYSLILCQKKINKNYLYNSLLISLISFFTSLPILINNFNQINFFSIIYNLFYVPFVSFIIFPFSILTLLLPKLDIIYIHFITIFENITMFLSSIKVLTFNVSNIEFPFTVLYYLLLYKVIFKNKKKILELVILIVFFINYKSIVINPTVTFIDVGQGDSSLIRIKNKNILIDTGGKVSLKKEKWKQKKKEYDLTSNTLIPYFKKEGVKQIDYLVLSHGDFDHMGESINLVNNFKIEKVMLNCGEFNDLEKKLIKVLNKKKIPYYSCINELNIDKTKLYFLQTKEYDNENDNSNVIYTEISNYKFMFMGDASSITEKEIMSKYNLPNVDVLKVGHHGSNTSSSKEFINEINPKYGVISVGKNNRYGHPNEEVLESLTNSKIYRTDIDGSVIFKIKNNKLHIETCSP